MLVFGLLKLLIHLIVVSWDFVLGRFCMMMMIPCSCNLKLCPEIFHACVGLLLCCSCIKNFVNHIVVCLTLFESCCLMMNIDDEVHDCS